MTDWKNVTIKLKDDEVIVLDKVAKHYKMSRNKLIKYIFGAYLNTELQNSMFFQLKLDKVMPKELIQDYQSLVKQFDDFTVKFQDHFSNSEMQKIIRKNWRETPKEIRDNLKRADTTVRSLTRLRRRKIGRPKKPAKKKRKA